MRIRSFWMLLAMIGLTTGTDSGRGFPLIARSKDAAAPWSEFDKIERPVPKLDLSVDRSVVDDGGSVVLRWNARDAASCSAAGGWTGVKALSGFERVVPSGTETFLLSCSGFGGGVLRRVTVTVGDDTTRDVTAAISADAEIVQSGQSVELVWSSENANSCTASGDWSGPQPTFGELSIGPVTSDRTYQLLCEGGLDRAMAAVSVRVGDRTLRWQQPEASADGTAIGDLAGYRIYWGATSGSYSGSHTINDPNARTWVADVGPGEYYFVVTAVDGEGNESGYSNEVLKLIP